MRPLRTSLLALAAIAAACSGSSDNTPKVTPDAGTTGVENPEAYYSLQKGRCFEYTTKESKQPIADLGVAVERIDTVQFDVPTYVVNYRIGYVRMTDYLAIDKATGDLQLYKREFAGGKAYRFLTPVTLMHAPVKGNDKIETATHLQVRDNTTGNLLEEKDVTTRIDTFDPSDVSVPAAGMVKANKVITDTGIGRSETRAFIPGAGADVKAVEGFGTIEFNFEVDAAKPNATYHLQNVRDLGDDNQAQQNPCGS